MAGNAEDRLKEYYISAAMRGDEDALAILLAQYYPELRGLIEHLMELADDTTST